MAIREPITMTLDRATVDAFDEAIKKTVYRSRSQAVEALMREYVEKLTDSSRQRETAEDRPGST
jgi:metal-responsive CopG/Arc/MetJ family transcriptional regulator